jgi:hypothetical protein
MDEQQYNPSLEQIEREILASVKFIDVILKETRSKDKELRENLGMHYAKHIGLTSPFEEMVKCLRKVRGELDLYLQMVRNKLSAQYRKEYGKRSG